MLYGTKSPEMTGHAQSETEGPNSMLSKIYNKLFANKAGAWTAVFTCVLAIFSYLLWQVSQDADRTSVATQAASVSSLGPGIAKIPNPDGKTLKGYNIFFTWINNGTTPTRTATLSANIYTGVATATKDLDFSQLPQDRVVTAVLGPKAGIQMSPGFISVQDLEDVQDGRRHMFFWGWTVYRDIFSSTPRLSEYCFNVEGAIWTKAKHDDVSGDVQLISNPCGVHFCFNEECEDYTTRTK
jgi:hypothetical protein